jgi:hypothetical protein
VHEFQLGVLSQRSHDRPTDAAESVDANPGAHRMFSFSARNGADALVEFGDHCVEGRGATIGDRIRQ